MSPSTFQVPQTPIQIPLPPCGSVVVINTSEGIGVDFGAASVLVDNSSDVSVDPQVGIVLRAGQVTTLPMVDDEYQPLQLWVVATAPEATITIDLDSPGVFDGDSVA